ncbi:hypothetical protein ACFE04_027301 [Oxalis oulophora]
MTEITAASFRASSLRVSNAFIFSASVGIELPILEVRYENLEVAAEAHVGSRALPSFKNFSINMVEGLLQTLHLRSSQKKHLDILQGISGIVQHSRLTLLLGPPGSGKTTFLLALAGRLDKELQVLGLDICADTMVGDEMIRGISGGQKKRVTTDQIQFRLSEKAIQLIFHAAKRLRATSRYFLAAKIKNLARSTNTDLVQLIKISRPASISHYKSQSACIFNRRQIS